MPGIVSLPGVVGFYFSFRLILVLLSVRVLGLEPQTGVAIDLGLNYLLLAFAAFHSFGPARSRWAAALRTPSSRWTLAFLGFSGCSLAWTAATSLAAASAFWCALAADVCLVLLLLRMIPARPLSLALLKGYVLGACAIALAAWILPAGPDLRLGDEDLLGPNQFGFACALGVFLGQYRMRLERGGRSPSVHSWNWNIWNFALGFLAVTLLRSLSKTTILAFLAGQAYLLLRDGSMSRRTKAGVIAAAFAAMAAASGLLTSYYDVYTNAGNQSETLTGRLGLWAIFLDRALEQPWLGHGFHSVWKVIPPFGPEAFEARHAHNELLQQFYAYGAVGVVLPIAVYRSFWRQVKLDPDAPRRTLLFSLLIFVLVRGIADTEPFDLSLPLWATILCSAVIAEGRSGRSERLKMGGRNSFSGLPAVSCAALSMVPSEPRAQTDRGAPFQSAGSPV